VGGMLLSLKPRLSGGKGARIALNQALHEIQRGKERLIGQWSRRLEAFSSRRQEKGRAPPFFFGLRGGEGGAPSPFFNCNGGQS